MKILIFGKADFDVVQLKEKLKVELKESRFAELEVKYRILPLDFLDEFFHLLLSKIIFLHDILNQLSHL